MAERSVPVDLRMVVATWPKDAPRGAVTRFCARHGVSRSWFYEVQQRAGLEGPVAAAAVRSRRPHRSPNQTPAAVEDLAVLARKQLSEDGWDAGPVSVRAWLLARGLPSPAPATLARIFTRRGLVVPQPGKRPRASYRRFGFAEANGCWQLDGTEWTLADGTKVCVLQVIDDCTRRLLASRACPAETADDAVAVVEQAIAGFGVPQMFLSDNGQALNPTRRGRRGKLVKVLTDRGVNVVSSTPGHPQTCGKNERVHATLKKWLRARPRAVSLVELQAQLERFSEDYNRVRPHQSLGGRTPDKAWAEATIAVEPTSPQRSDAPRRGRQHGLIVRTVKVSATGVAPAGRYRINLGHEHAQHRVLVTIDGDLVNIFTSNGEHLRTLTVDPGRIFYGNGRPRGGYQGRRRSRPTGAQSSTMS